LGDLDIIFEELCVVNTYRKSNLCFYIAKEIYQ